MVQLSSKPVRVVSRKAASFATGSTPGKPRQTGQTFVLGGAPNSLAQPHHIFDLVLSWTWVSSPMTASYSMTQKIGGLAQSLCQPRGLFASAPRIVRTPAPFAADDGSNRLDNFAGLNPGSEFRRNGRDQRHRVVSNAAQDNDAFELALERICHSLQIIAIGRTKVLDDRAQAV